SNTTTLGSFTIDTTNHDTGNGGSIGWSFSVADSAIDYLQAGQVVTQAYVVSVDDGHGGTTPQTVTITMTGTNDAPVITSGTQAGSVTEIADLAAGENTTTHTQSGAVTFTDADTLDSHSATFAAAASNTTTLGSFTIDTTNHDTGNGGSIGWSFSVADSAIDYLQAGQVVTQAYVVSVDDGHGGTTPQTVTITMTGTNDAPVITSGTQAGSVTEIADLAAGENTTTHTQSGAVTFSDADTLDSHTATFAAAASNTTTLGSFTIDTTNHDTGNGGSIGWSFSVADSAIDYLQAGQVVTQAYVVSVDDGHGGTTPQTVTITITGTNDAPVITSGTQAGSVTEIADLAAGENTTTHTQSGAVTFTDADTLDSHSATFAAAASNTTTLGSFTIDTTNHDTGNGGSIGWSFSVADSAIDYLQAGQVVTQA